MNKFQTMPDKDLTPFNTRLTPDQITKLKAYAFYRRVAIQDVTQAAVQEFFNSRTDEIDKALEAYENKNKPL